MKSIRVIIRNRLGLHARPSMALTDLANTFECDIVVRADGRTANAKSVMDLFSKLQAAKGAEIVIEANGPNEEQAILAMQDLVSRRFDEVPLILVGGCGSVGEALCEMLEHAGVNVTIIDRDDQVIRAQTARKRKAVLGDITDRRVLLDLAQADMADALILTVRDITTAEEACAQVRRVAPSIFIAACVETSEAARRIVAEADYVTSGQLAVAASLRDAVIAGVGISGA
ncbi:MAG: HPr family phosphocarrier protein [Planctomycetota bacterium]|nr:HPr family phosphocarrier protein [Planctomycetota bacterium]